MTEKKIVDAILAQKTLAVVGVSRDPNKFGSRVYQELKSKGYHVLPVNLNIENLYGDRCYPNLGAIPEPVGAVILITQPAQTEQVVKEAAAAGIGYIWMQQGAESPEAIRFCQENGLQAVHGECIMMYAQPAGFHKFHRWINGLMGKLAQ